MQWHKIHQKNMKEAANFIWSIYVLIMIDTLLLRPSLHFTILHYTCWHFTSSHLNFTQLHFTTLLHNTRAALQHAATQPNIYIKWHNFTECFDINTALVTDKAPWWLPLKTETCRSDIIVYFNVNLDL